MKRNSFNRIIAAAFGHSFLPEWLRAGKSYDYPYQTLPEAFKAISFDPSGKGNSFFVVTADVHYGSKGADGMIETVKEVNRMNPRPAFYCVNGDLIVNGSRSFGTIPDASAKALAKQEFLDFKKDADLLHSEIPLKLTLGNHDTHPGETDPEMFHEVYPLYPPYQSMDVQGVQMLFLNGHSTGYIDTLQMKWLLDETGKISKRKTVIVFVHQPSMSRTVRERGIPEAITQAFENHRGDIWLIGGHEHVNDQKIYKLKNTRLTEHHITCGTINIWGGPERPGYWIYCLHSGKVTARIFRQRFKGYRLETAPDLSTAQDVPRPFDGVENIVWKHMVKQNDRTFLESAKAADCLNYWAYVKELVYRVPIRDIKGSLTKIALLTDHQTANHNKPGQYFLSTDKVNWQEVTLEKAVNETLIFPVNKSLTKSASIYFKFSPAGEAAVAGIAALT